MAHALGATRQELLLRHLDAPAPPVFESLLARRLAYEPVAYITGRRAFWTIELEVGPGVLIPRPDSETLIEAAVERFGPAAPARILDLGTGAGHFAARRAYRMAAGQRPRRRPLPRPRSPMLGVMRERLGLAERADFRLGDWGAGVTGPFDLILCNPPYVETGAALPRDVAGHEPAEALFAGADGLDAYRRLAPQVAGLLRPGGIACVEIGAGQEAAVGALFTAAKLRVASRPDLAGIPRCLTVSH
jgi:release factor glutamine methyltransferase